MPWARALKQAAAGEGVVYGVYRTAERSRSLRFSRAVGAHHTWAVVREADATRVQRLADLRDAELCWARGSAYASLFAESGGGRPRVQEVRDDDTGFRMVQAQRCDAAFLTMEDGHRAQALRHPALRELRDRGLTLTQRPLAALPMHFAAGLQSRWAWLIDRADAVVGRSGAELDRLRRGG